MSSMTQQPNFICQAPYDRRCEDDDPSRCGSNEPNIQNRQQEIPTQESGMELSSMEFEVVRTKAKHGRLAKKPTEASKSGRDEAEPCPKEGRPPGLSRESEMQANEI